MRFHLSVTQFGRLIFALSFAATASGINFTPSIQAQEEGQVNLGQFDMLTTTSGWVLLNGHLFWTFDTGQTWNEISPTIPPGAMVQDVEFIDSNTGWVLLSTINPDGGALFQLAHTTDNGITWTTRPLSFFESGEIPSYAEKAEMGWSDTQTGWISVKQTSGSNFSIGTLFATSDGGNTWSRSALPVADKIVFDDLQTGWAIGGPTGDQVFKTQDAGATWQNARPDNIPEGIQTTAYPPFVSGGQGLLVMTNLGSENSLNVYALENTSDKWLLLHQVPLDVQPGVIGLSILDADAQNLVATIPGTKSIVRLTGSGLDVLDNKDDLSASIVELDMVSLDVGWAKSIDSSCVAASSQTDQSASVICSSAIRFLHTTDGGMTWQDVPLPLVRSDTASPGVFSGNRATAENSLSNLGNAQILIGQGFDKCEIPTLSQMQTWSNNSPYKAVNLYIGGSNRACDNVALTSTYLKQLYQQGWKFIPTWVGPQAPCTGYVSRMSADVPTAHNQGINEANLAVERLAELVLTFPDKTGSVVYYDIEHYGTDTACRDTVNAFMNGWVSQIHARGNLAGVYGSTVCNTGLSDFRTITYVPDLIWPARWYHNLGSGFYDPNASVWDLGSCLPNTVWANHQRIRQYEGSHNETWGELTLEIDSNVLDGVVATPYVAPLVKDITRADSNPTSAVTVGFTVTFSESVTGVDSGDFMLTTTGVTGASITNVNGSGTTYMLTVNTGTGIGTIRLDVVDDDSIKDAGNDPLGGAGAGNGNFMSGEIYTIAESANIDVMIGGDLKGNYDLAPSKSTRESYTGVDNGPVQVVSTNGVPIVAGLRELWVQGGLATSSFQMMGLPEPQISDTYLFPAYNNVTLNEQLRFGNVDGVDTTVTVKIGGNVMGSYLLHPNEQKRVNYVGLDSGPVEVKSSGGVKIIAAIRDAWFENGVVESFTQLMGLPAPQLSDTYWFPSYNNVTLNEQLRFANVGTSNTTVTVTIGGNIMGTYPLQPNEQFRVNYPGIDSGPVKVKSSGGVKIIAAIREAFVQNGMVQSWIQMMGLPAPQLSDSYLFPAYDNVTLNGQLRFGNVGTSNTTVTVTIGGFVRGTYPLTPNQQVRVNYAGLDSGPVKVESSGGVKIIAALRDALTVNGVVESFAQMMGLPATQLSDTYLFPAYNNVTLGEQLRIGVP